MFGELIYNFIYMKHSRVGEGTIIATVAGLQGPLFIASDTTMT